MTPYSPKYLAGLVRELVKHHPETPWLEFKHDKANPQEIGEYVSALSNSAAIEGKTHGYLVWGVDDKSHDILGTTFSPGTTKKGNQPLESWLLQMTEPRIRFEFHEGRVDDKRVVVLEVERARSRPVAFGGREYVRIGQVKKPLRDAPELERQLWRTFDDTPFEKMIAAEHQSADDVLRLLDWPAYFDLLKQRLPTNPDGILDAIHGDHLIERCPAGGWDITNLGALLFAKRMGDFPSLARKAVRVIQYHGKGRINAAREQEKDKGYASGFEDLVDYINGLLPSSEVIGRALRETVHVFPEVAVRELVANALIHQDLHAKGANIMVEIFDGRIEISNPGEPLVPTNRFVDAQPKSRNESIVALMRRFGIGEDRGTGIDKVLSEVERYQLPAPLFQVPPHSTRTVLFAHKNLREMSKSERIRACYLHACLCYVDERKMTNATLRERFGITSNNAAEVSRFLKDAVEAGAILIEDPSAGSKARSYIPSWARHQDE